MSGFGQVSDLALLEHGKRTKVCEKSRIRKPCSNDCDCDRASRINFRRKILAAKKLDRVWDSLMADDTSPITRRANEQIFKEILFKTVPPQYYEEVQEAMHNFDLLVSKAA